MKIKLDHINLTVIDLNESITWYQNLFEFQLKEGELTNLTEPWAIIGKDDSMLCLYEDKNLKSAAEAGDGPFHRVYHFGIRIDDREAWEEKLRSTGVKVRYGGAYQYPRSVSWYISDPSGHEIEVSWCGGRELEFSA